MVPNIKWTGEAENTQQTENPKWETKKHQIVSPFMHKAGR